MVKLMIIANVDLFKELLDIKKLMDDSYHCNDIKIKLKINNIIKLIKTASKTGATKK